MTRPLLARLHRAGPWFCSTAILLFVALSPVIFVTASGDQWIWRWILAGVPVVALTLWLTAMAYDRAPAESVEAGAESVEVDDESAVVVAESVDMDDETTISSPTSADSAPTTEDSAPTSTDSAGAAGRGGDAGMRVAVLSLSRKVQASAHRIQEESTRMVAKFPAEPDVLEAGMRVDHAAAQQARLAQSIATLCGEQPGQHWRDPLAIADVVRGAAGRITAYRRVRVEGDPPAAVQGAYVEPLIHLVAELLANATQSSPPATEVLVTIRSVRRGAALEIDDAGVGMDETNLAWMREIASGTRQVRLQDLGEIPQTGLAVVGTYVRRHGFRVDLTESVHGGLRVAVLVPEAMTTPLSPPTVEAEPRTPVSTPMPASLLAQAPKAPPASTTPAWPVHAAAKAPDPLAGLDKREPSLFTSDGLPQRRSKRGQRFATGQQPVGRVIPPRPEPTAEQAGAWMSSFLSAPATSAAGTTIPHQAVDPTDGSTAAETDSAPENHWRNHDR
ncbi:periplasmic sensor signal transduction histidine kinase [Nocardioidaceae bacterium Broad-1]|nr:periplasmic sensor signal transduction histidine kinase [Nocardioidaceae bacterium Broad-1]